jgi:hypothetical protein
MRTSTSMYTPVMCLDFFIYVYSHYLTCIFLHFHVDMSMPIDVSSIDLLFHEESTHTHCHARSRTGIFSGLALLT